jgi:hypothetical protein
MLTSIRNVAPKNVSVPGVGTTVIGKPARSKLLLAAIFLLGVGAVAFILSRHHVHWQWKATWVAVVALAEVAILCVTGAIGRSPAQPKFEPKADRGPSSHLSQLLADLKARESPREPRAKTSEVETPKFEVETPKVEALKIETPVMEPVRIKVPIVEVEPLTSLDLTAAQRLVAEQRKAAEALLLEACVLEDRLKSEAKAAQAAGEYAAAKAKVEAAAAMIAEWTTKQAEAQREAATAQERAEALQKELSAATQGLAGIHDVQALAARIAEQASALQRGQAVSR